MRATLDLRRHHYVARVSISLIVIALVAGMVGCGGDGPSRYNLTMAADPAAGGTATDETNGSPYTAGTAVSIKAEAGTGYEFVSWTAPSGGFADADAEETTFTMPAQDVTVTANFEEISSDILLIRDWHDLHAIRDNAGDSYLLMNDLDSTTAGYEELAGPAANGGKGWQPSGSLDYDTGELIDPFSGSFDGQGYEIRDLFVNRPDEDILGLFGVVHEGGVVENIGVVNADVTGRAAIGSLAGVNIGIITDCYAAGIVDGDEEVGGLVGHNEGTVSDSYSSGDVISGTDAEMRHGIGGLVGENGGIINDCYSISSLTGGAGSSNVGGLVGGNWEGTVSNCYATGSVTGATSVGGLVGGNPYESIVSNSYSTGSVEGDENIGGLVGFNRDSTVSDSYSTGSVTGDYDVGGLVGENWEGTVSDSYSTGSVTGDSDVGGLVGENEEGTVSDSFWDIETSGQAASDGGTGKTTTQMKEFVTFSDWDIIIVGDSSERNSQYIWNIVDTVTYPFLSWQSTS